MAGHAPHHRSMKRNSGLQKRRPIGRRTLAGLTSAAAASLCFGEASLSHARAPSSQTTRLDASLLNAAIDRAAGYERLHSLVVARGGTVAVAEAFRGAPIDQPVNVKSVSKTIVAALTGALLDRGEIGHVDDPLSSIAPQLLPNDADPRVGSLTVRRSFDDAKPGSNEHRAPTMADGYRVPIGFASY